MELSWENTQIRQLCEDEDFAKVKLGPNVAQSLQSRLADLDAASTIEDLVAGNPAEITFKDKPCYKLDLGEAARIVFCASNVKIPLTNDEQINWKKVTRIKIISIENE